MQVTNLNFVLNVGDGWLTNFSFLPPAEPVLAGETRLLGGPDLGVQVSALSGQSLMGSLSLGRLQFNARPDAGSMFLTLFPQNILGQRNGEIVEWRQFAQPGRVVIVSTNALLEPILSSNRQATLLLYGMPGLSYALEYTTELAIPTHWLQWPVTATNLMNVLDQLPATNESLFFRLAPGQTVE
jgi:hypothetical protein